MKKVIVLLLVLTAGTLFAPVRPGAFRNSKQVNTADITQGEGYESISRTANINSIGE